MAQHPAQEFTKIREVAKELGLTLRALRFYEIKGLVSPKRQLRKRLYSNEDVEQLRLVVKLKGLGLSILEIKQLVKHPGNGPYGLSVTLYAELIERGEAQKLAAETALAQLRQIAGQFCLQRPDITSDRKMSSDLASHV